MGMLCICTHVGMNTGFSGGRAVKNLPEMKETTACQCRRHGFSPWVGTIPWSRKWQPTPAPVFLPGKFQGQRNLANPSAWGHRDSDTIEQLSTQKAKAQLLVSEVAQSCLTLCDPGDCTPPGSSIHGILQARTLEWVAISFSRGSSRSRDQTQVSRIAGRRFNL